MSKNFLKSKTFWYGALNIIAGVVFYFQGVISGAELFTFNGLFVIVLRALTEKPITIGRGS